MASLIFTVIVPLLFISAQSVVLNENPKLVVFSFDGFRFDYLDKRFGPNMEQAVAPTLRTLRAQGVTTPYMIPQFTSKTFPNHQSIVTGLYTEKHGIVDNSVYDIELGKNVSGYDDDREFWVYNNQILPLWTLNEMAGNGRRSGAQFPGSTQIYGTENLEITFPLGYNGAMPFQERMDYTINWLTHPTTPANLIFMYFEEPDSQGHKYGPNSLEVKAAIEELDKLTEYFLEALRRLEVIDRVNIIILSDHGMEEVKEKNKVALSDLISAHLGYSWGGGSPVLQIWPFEESETDQIHDEFVVASQSRPFSVYRKENLPAHWHYLNQRRIAPILIVTDPGFSFDEVWTDAEVKGIRSRTAAEEKAPETPSGYHGYDTEAPNMRSFFMATGPAFESNKTVDPFFNVDLFPLMCQVLNIPPPEHDGNFANVVATLRPIPPTDDGDGDGNIDGGQSTQKATTLVSLSIAILTQVVNRLL